MILFVVFVISDVVENLLNFLIEKFLIVENIFFFIFFVMFVVDFVVKKVIKMVEIVEINVKRSIKSFILMIYEVCILFMFMLIFLYLFFIVEVVV